MKKLTLKPLCLAIGVAMAGSASAMDIDFSGTNFYMKFLDGNQRTAAQGSIDTTSGADQGQFTEMNLVFKATISPKVEAGGRIQSRSSASYWTDYGGFGNEGNVNNNVNDMKFMKLRGAYVQLSPGYSWLTQARVGTSDWGMFDPFTMGKIRYIDRDNFNGLYFKGPMVAGNSWEFARVSLPNYLGTNFSSGTTLANQANQAIYIAQFKQGLGNTRLMEGITYLNDQQNDPADTNLNNGQNLQDRFRNTILSLKADTGVGDSVALRGAFHHSTFSINNPAFVAVQGGNPYCFSVGPDPAVSGNGCGSTTNSFLTTGVFGYSMTPGANVNDNAYKVDLDWTPANIGGFSVNYQYFNIGAGYVSVGGARRESDVLLTEGSEAAWYRWGSTLWAGGRANDMQQVAVIQADNGFTDFDETGAESVLGWRGNTFKLNYEAADTPMSLELTRVGYNTNWQNYGGRANIYDVGHGQGTYDVYLANQERSTNIVAFKLAHTFAVMGGLDANFKYKTVNDMDKRSATTSADDRYVLDNGATFSLGNQLTNDLYGTVSYGRYIRDIKSGVNAFNNSKSIYSLKFAYNLPGFETGLLTQWIQGHGNPSETVGADAKIMQYRLKAYAQVNF